MAKASDFKFGTQLGFPKVHHKITPRGTSGGSLGLGELLKIFGFPCNISATAGTSDFKFGAQLGFAKDHHQGPGLGELPEIWGFPFNISATAEAGDFKFCTQLGFVKTHHKITPRRKVGVALG